MQSLREIQVLQKYKYRSLKRLHKALQINPGPLLVLCGLEMVLQYSLWLTWWLEEAPLPFVLPLTPTAVALLRRACSWSNSRSSRRWVKASFCWMAIRNREFRVFFSSSAATSCLCMSSSWVTYSSHLREREGRGGEKSKKRENKETRDTYYFQQVEQRALLSHVFSIPQTAFSRWEDEVSASWLASITSDCSHNALWPTHKHTHTLTQNNCAE